MCPVGGSRPTLCLKLSLHTSSFECEVDRVTTERKILELDEFSGCEIKRHLISTANKPKPEQDLTDWRESDLHTVLRGHASL